jgi:hypothetical protein
VIAALATVAAALISTFKPGDSAPPSVGQQITSPMFPPRDVPHNPADHPDQPSIQMKSVVFRQAGDGRFILVKGYISALGTSGEL